MKRSIAMSEGRNIIKELLDNPESAAIIKQWAEDLRRRDRIVQTQADRFHVLSDERKTEILQKFYEKYMSKEHCELRFSPFQRLFGEFSEMLLTYGRKYKEQMVIDGYILPHECYKVHEGFYILDSVWTFLWSDKEIAECKEHQSERETLKRFVSNG